MPTASATTKPPKRSRPGRPDVPTTGSGPRATRLHVGAIPPGVLRRMERYVTRHRIVSRGALIALCAVAGFEALEKKEGEAKTPLDG